VKGAVPNRLRHPMGVLSVHSATRTEHKMNVDAWPRTAILAALHMQKLNGATENAEQTLRINSMRSVGNIRTWRTYLPEDCVNTMIKMRWDQTT
jgi:hypothetical protein